MEKLWEIALNFTRGFPLNFIMNNKASTVTKVLKIS